MVQLLSLSTVALALAASAIAAPTGSTPEPRGEHPHPHPSPAVCKPYGNSGLLKLHNYDTNALNGTVYAEGQFSAVADAGNTNLKAQFYACSFKGFHYAQGSSRNGGGSMGAPLEHFGQVRINGDCLTGFGGDSTASPSTFRHTVCATSSSTDEEKLRQLFVFQESGFGPGPAVAYLGVKNSTAKPYQGPTENFYAGTPHGAFPAPILVSTEYNSQSLQLVSSE